MRTKHLFASGGSGSGKSEVLKSGILYQIIARRPGDALLIIDPHGELSYQTALWPEVQDRLVYLDPYLFPGDATPTYNPFAITPEPHEVEAQINQLLTTISAVLSEDSEFTEPMTSRQVAG